MQRLCLSYLCTAQFWIQDNYLKKKEFTEEKDQRVKKVFFIENTPLRLKDKQTKPSSRLSLSEQPNESRKQGSQVMNSLYKLSYAYEF